MSTLYIIATPIGHLGDISLRALEVLRSVDLIAAEDTRHSRKLLAHYQITTPLVAYHAHNESESAKYLIQQLQQGKSIGVISDAGTPLISDPGYVLVKTARASNIKVVPIPGACAAIAALSAAGLPSERFVFEGFLPAKASARQTRLHELQSETRTLLFYEAPHRIQETLTEMAAIFGAQREATIARELTKTFETIYQDTLAGLCNWLERDPQQQRGEFVIIVTGAAAEDIARIRQKQAEQLFIELAPHLPLKQAVTIAAQIFNISKNALYSWALHRRS